MTNTNIEILFEQPVRIKQGIEIVEFNNKTEEKQHLLINNNRHYTINNFVYSLLQTISKFESLEEIKNEFSNSQNKKYSEEEIVSLINEVLAKKELIETIKPVENKKNKSFLYFKIPVFSKKLLHPITFIFQNLFRSYIAHTFLSLIIISHILLFASISNQAKLADLINNPISLIIVMTIMLFSVIFHEFGHSSACRFFGANYEEIGFGIYLRFPVFYSNITDAWRLPPYQRVIIDVAGIYFQYIFNLILIVFFLITKLEILIVAVKIICIQTLFSLNPFFRYDGYWIATDLLGIPNLRKKSQEMLSYLTQKYLFRKKVKNPVTNSIKSINKKFFTIYAGVSNIFFIYIIVVFSTRLPFIIKDFSQIIQDCFNVLQNAEYHTIQEISIAIFRLITRVLITALSMFFFYNIIRRVIKTFKNLFNDQPFKINTHERKKSD